MFQNKKERLSIGSFMGEKKPENFSGLKQFSFSKNI